MSTPIFTAKLRGITPDGLKLTKNATISLALRDIIQVSKLGATVLLDFVPNGAPGGLTLYRNYLKATITNLPSGLSLSENYGSGGSSQLSGAPTTVGTSPCLVRLEIVDMYYDGGFQAHVNYGCCYITLPIEVVNEPSTGEATGTTLDPVLLSDQSLQTGIYTSVDLAATGVHSVDSWIVSGLPPGLTKSYSSITGTPSATGSYQVTATLRYRTEEDGPIQEAVKTVTFSIVSNSPNFVEDGAVDLFFDLQSRTLSLTLPKAEAVLNEGQTVVNGLKAETLLIKTGETLWFNVRFTKGERVVDPDPTAMRFGVAAKIGGPLVMESASFTKVGSGSTAYFKMRVPTSASEFAAIASDYYNEDAVENPNFNSAAQTNGQEPLTGLCELELTTGTGGTLATLKSDTMPVILSRSILS